MSTTVSPLPMPLSPTRRQLDELDELLKRVLDLPGGREEEPPPVLPGSRPSYQTQEPPSSSTSEEPPRLPEFRAPNPDDWVRLAATWQPSPQTWGPLAESWKQSARIPPVPAPRVEPFRELPAIAPAPEALGPPPLAAELPAPSLPAEPEQTEPAPEAGAQQESSLPVFKQFTRERDEPTPTYLWPLVGFNVVFDAGLLLFGPLGKWLRGRSGRNFLGGAGLTMFALAAACLVGSHLGYLVDLQLWLADWFGWTL